MRFPQVPGLRPTPGRLRETLFNWLAPDLPGTHCLDLFAGSGALGIEALSRGASEVTLVERNPRAVALLREHARHIGAGPALHIFHGDVASFLRRQPARAMDVVFIDPPFRSHMYEFVGGRLVDFGWLQPRAWIYVEVARGDQWLPPATWELHRRQSAGDVQASLYRYDVNSV